MFLQTEKVQNLNSIMYQGGVKSFTSQTPIKGENSTELEQVIANIPWANEFSFGAGVDAITGGTSGSAVKSFEPTQKGSKSSKESYRFIQSDSEFNREIQASASGKYNIEGVTIEASASYLNQIKYSELVTTLIAEYESYYDDYFEVETYELTDAAKNLISNPTQFRKSYGDYFVAGSRKGSRFVAIYTCRASSVESMDEFKGSFGAEAPEVFSAKGSVSFSQAVKDHKINLEVNLFMRGYDGNNPSGPWTPETILNALKWFKENEKGANLQAKLKHYSTIDPNYRRDINVLPEVFVELRQLYTKVWDIRSKYASIPTYYQDQLKQEYVALDSGIQANQDVLVIDKATRDDYQNKADILISNLNDIAARMDFYFKVKDVASSEPANGKKISEGRGQQTWSYGYSVYAKSDAVVIHNTQLNYKAGSHVGYREHTFEFGPYGNYLIVGWEVISHWGDGTNGSWWKAIDQILLTDYAVVRVKSKYDRGCNWSLKIYYVDAKDYQFQDAKTTQ